MHKRRLIQFALAGLAGLTIHPLAAAAASQTADEDLPLLVAGMDAAYPPFGFKDFLSFSCCSFPCVQVFQHSVGQL